jgi:hypothetical protein
MNVHKDLYCAPRILRADVASKSSPCLPTYQACENLTQERIYSFQAHKRNQGLSVTKIGASLLTSWENAWTSCCDSGSPPFNNLQDSNIATLANNFLSYFPRTRGECDACVINLGSYFAKLRLKAQNRRRGGLCSY